MAKKLPPEVQAIISATDAGLYATTVKLVQEYLIDHPDSQRAWLDLGHALAQLSRYSEAEQAYQKAMELTDEGPVDVVYGELGNLFRAQGKFPDAQQWFEKQINADPSDATGYLFLGNLLRQLGKFEEAIDILSKGIECDCGVGEEVHFSLGEAYRSCGRYFDAKQQYQRALEIDPKYAAAKRSLKDVSNLQG